MIKRGSLQRCGVSRSREATADMAGRPLQRRSRRGNWVYSSVITLFVFLIGIIPLEPASSRVKVSVDNQVCDDFIFLKKVWTIAFSWRGCSELRGLKGGGGHPIFKCATIEHKNAYFVLSFRQTVWGDRKDTLRVSYQQACLYYYLSPRFCSERATISKIE